MALAERFLVSRRTIDEVIERVRKQEFEPRKSTNKHFLQEKYGMKRLAKVEVFLENQKNCGLATTNHHLHKIQDTLAKDNIYY